MQSDKLIVMLPEAPPEWQMEGEPKQYTPDDLYKYINGGAELYLSFGFQEAASCVYTRDNQPDILLDLFDMGSSQSAFGVFSHSRERLETDFGQGSQSDPGLLIFWKDRYYVSLLANPETPVSRKAVSRIARQIEQTIPETGPLPEILNALPGEGLIEESIRTFQHHAWINTYYTISEENLLDISRKNPAVLAKYNHDRRRLLLIVAYTGEKAAADAFETFCNAFFKDGEDAGFCSEQTADSSWTAAGRVGNHVAVIFQGESRDAVLAFFNRVRRRIHSVYLNTGEDK